MGSWYIVNDANSEISGPFEDRKVAEIMAAKELPNCHVIYKD